MVLFANIDFLPDEVLNEIFSYLAPFEIKRKIALVCKRWNALSKNANLIVKLEFGPSLTTETVVSVLQQFKNLKALKFFGRRDINDLLPQVALSNNRLTRLKINTSRDHRFLDNFFDLCSIWWKGPGYEIKQLTDVDTFVLLQVIRSCTKLKELIIKRCNFDDPNLFYSSLGKSLPSIEALNLNHNLQLNSDQLIEMIKNMKPLEDLRIYCLAFNRIGSVTPYGNPAVVRMTQKMSSSLKILKLNMLGLSDDVMRSIAECKNLKVLHLYRLLNINDTGIMMISRLPLLETLVVTVPRAVTSEGWKNVIKEKNFQNLKSLMISNSSSTDDSVLSAIGANCTLLRKFSIPGCRQVTNIGLRSVMEGCGDLESLNLFSTRGVVSESFDALPELLPNLRFLIFRSVDRQNVNFTELADRMPNLTISTSYRYL